MLKTLEPVVSADRKDASCWIVGVRLDFKLTGRDTGGAFSLAESVVAPGAGPPPHTHEREDETFIMIEGRLKVTVGGRELSLEAGETAFLPRGVEHAFTNETDAPAKMLFLITPAGFENFLMKAGRPAGAPDEPAPPVTDEDIARLFEHAAEFGLDLGPPPGS
jgi:quercetin dioxygenase-like cupin family protein